MRGSDAGREGGSDGERGIDPVGEKGKAGPRKGAIERRSEVVTEQRRD